MTRASSKEVNMAKMELKKLKSILPTLKQKRKSTPLEIILETIRYIQQLEDQLIDRFQTNDISDSISQSSLSNLSTLSNDFSLSSSIPLKEIGNSN